MSQNISSRKQELLSRLKTTLAIVSQATGFDQSDEASSNRSRELPQWASQRDPRLHRRSEASTDDPGDSLYRDSLNPSEIEERRGPALASVLDKIGDIDDEDEFLYGTKETTPQPPAASSKPSSDTVPRSEPSRSNQWMESGRVRDDPRWNRNPELATVAVPSHDTTMFTSHDNTQWSGSGHQRRDVDVRWTSGSASNLQTDRDDHHWMAETSQQPRDDMQWSGHSSSGGQPLQQDDRRWTRDRQQAASVVQRPADITNVATIDPQTAQVQGLNQDIFQSILKLITGQQQQQPQPQAVSVTGQQTATEPRLGLGQAGGVSSEPFLMQQSTSSQPTQVVYQSSSTFTPPAQRYDRSQTSAGFGCSEQQGQVNTSYSSAATAAAKQVMTGYSQSPSNQMGGASSYSQFGGPAPAVFGQEVRSALNQSSTQYNSQLASGQILVSNQLTGHVAAGSNERGGRQASDLSQVQLNQRLPSSTAFGSNETASIAARLSSTSTIPSSTASVSEPTSTVNVSNIHLEQPPAASVPPSSKTTSTAVSSDLGSDSKPASSGQRQGVEELKGTLDRLLSMIGCNDNIVQLMKEIMQKDEQEKAKGAATVSTSVEISQETVPPQMDVKNLPEVKEKIAAEVRKESEMARKANRDSTESAINMPIVVDEKTADRNPPGSVKDMDEIKVAVTAVPAASIPVLSSLSNLQKSYDSGEDSDSATNVSRKKKGSSKPAGGQSGGGKEYSEWERSTEEFLRSLQAKPPKSAAVAPSKSSKERSLSPRRRRSRSTDQWDTIPKRSPIVDMFDTNQGTKRDSSKEMPPTKATDKSAEPVDSAAVLEAERPTLTADERNQLLKAKSDIVSTMDLLQHELINLEQHKSSLLRSTPDGQCNEQLERNVSMQSEIGEHICSLQKALEDINRQLDKCELPPVKPASLAVKPSDMAKKSGNDNNAPSQRQRGRKRSSSRSFSSSRSSSSGSSSSTSSSRSRGSDRRRRRRSRSVSRSRNRNQRRATGRFLNRGGNFRDNRRRPSRDRKESFEPRKSKGSQKPEIIGRGSEKDTRNVETSLKTVFTGASTGDQQKIQTGRDTKAPSSTSGPIFPITTTSSAGGQQPSAPPATVPVSSTAVDPVRTNLPVHSGAERLSSMAPPPGAILAMASSASIVTVSAAGVLFSEAKARTAIGLERDGSSSGSGSMSFSRENIVRSLQEMVKPSNVTANEGFGSSGTAAKEEFELSEKQRSALEFAISMYMVANEFYDGGSLWCRLCDGMFGDMSGLCRHLHSDQHQLKLDPDYNKPKAANAPKKPCYAEGSLVAPARGDEFLMPLQAFFCSLCCEFSKDNASAEAHIKSREHNNKFKNFLKDNPTYEMQYLRGKMSAATSAAFREMEQHKLAAAACAQPRQQPSAEAAVVADFMYSKVELSKRKLDEKLETDMDIKRVKVTGFDDKVQTGVVTKQNPVVAEKEMKVMFKQSIEREDARDNGDVKRFTVSAKAAVVTSQTKPEGSTRETPRATEQVKSSGRRKSSPSPDKSRWERDRSPGGKSQRRKDRRSRDRSPDNERSRKRSDDRYDKRSPFRSVKSSLYSLMKKEDNRDRDRDFGKEVRKQVEPAATDKTTPVSKGATSSAAPVVTFSSSMSSTATVVKTSTTSPAMASTYGMTEKSHIVSVTGVAKSSAAMTATPLRMSTAVSMSASARPSTATVTSAASYNPMPKFNFAWVPRAVRPPAKKPGGTVVVTTAATSQPSNAAPAEPLAGALKFNMRDFEVLDECDDS